MLAIHGGAGGTLPPHLPPHLETAYREALRRSLNKGYAVLHRGGSAIDAVCESVKDMEDDPLFNAAKGAVFTTAGTNECEASVMVAKQQHENTQKQVLNKENTEETTDLHTRRCSSAILIQRTKNPVMLAKTLLQNDKANPHVILSGSQAEATGWSLGCEKVSHDYFFTRRRWLEHRRGLGLPDDPVNADSDLPPSYPEANSLDGSSARSFSWNSEKKRRASQSSSRSWASDTDLSLSDLPAGTVGAVALDQFGGLAVATSTGGKTNKLPGRVGDTPVPGAGFWAEYWTEKKDHTHSFETPLGTRAPPSLLAKFSSLCQLVSRVFTGSTHGERMDEEKQMGNQNETQGESLRGVAISGTGDGDYFLRTSFATLLTHRMRFMRQSLEDAGREAVSEMASLGGAGGAICVDEHGHGKCTVCEGGQ